MDACNVLFFAGPGFDYSTSQLIEGLYRLYKQDEIELKCTQANTHHGAQVGDMYVTTEEHMLDHLEWADFIFYSSAGNMEYCMTGPVGKVLAEPSFKNRVFLDGHDGDQLLVNPDSLLLYLKREMRYPLCNYHKYFNIRSLQFGVYQYLLDSARDNKAWNDRDIDVCFMAFGGSNKTRQECADVLWESDFKIEVHVSDDSQPIEQDKYHDILYRSKVGISIFGAGLDTLRFWETPAHGAVLCSMDLSTLLQMRNAFEGNRHCLYFTSWPMMLEQIGLVVNNKSNWARMRRAMDLCIPEHSTTNRAREALQLCQEMV